MIYMLTPQEVMKKEYDIDNLTDEDVKEILSTQSPRRIEALRKLGYSDKTIAELILTY
ncbi:MAG: hypothetical protein PHT58_00815 [Eubacteriales bacterium]|nr:hypothetical protein [Eubacteriales bacterium]